MKLYRKEGQPSGDMKELKSCLDSFCERWIRERLMMENLCLSNQTLKETAERYSADIAFLVMTSINNMLEDDISNVRKLLSKNT